MKAPQPPCYDYYGTLCYDIDILLKLNDKYQLCQIKQSELFERLTNEQKSNILEKLQKAEETISCRLMHGEITPMDIDEQGRTRDDYITYLCYLKHSVFPSDPQKAQKLAFEVYKCVLLDEYIDNKEIFDEYFSLLLNWKKKEDAFKKNSQLNTLDYMTAFKKNSRLNALDYMTELYLNKSIECKLLKAKS